MKIKKLILVNWGPMLSGEFDMGDTTLLTGESGAGKSTFLDAIQLVTSAGYVGMFSFNSGQNETTQTSRNGKTKRLPQSYILGADGDVFARPHLTTGYIALVMAPDRMDPESAKPFTMVFAGLADVSGPARSAGRTPELKQQAFYTLEGIECELSDFATRNGQGVYDPIPFGELYKRLRLKYGQAPVQNYGDRKQQYLCAWVGLCRGFKQVSWQEAQTVIKTFTYAFAARPLGPIHELIRDEALEPEEGMRAQVEQLAETAKNMHRLREEAARLNTIISGLDGIASAADATLDGYREWAVQTALAVEVEKVSESRKLESAQRELEQAAQQASELDSEIRSLRAQEALNQDKRVGLEKRMAQVDVAAKQAEIEREMQFLHKQLAIQATPVHEAIERLSAVADAAGMAVELAGSTGPLKAAAAAVQTRIGSAPQALEAARESYLAASLTRPQEMTLSAVHTLAKDAQWVETAFAPLVQELAASGLAQVAEREQGTLQARCNDLERRIAQLQLQIRSAAGGRVSYPQEVVLGLELLERELPASKPRVLCDLIEPVDPKWQPAIETLMGGARFWLVVEPDYEEQAIRLFKRTLGRHGRSATIAQCNAALRDHKGAAPIKGSILEELRFLDKRAEALVARKYGRNVKVASDAELVHQPAGLTIDGAFSAGYGMRAQQLLSASDLVFGIEARRRAAQAAERDLEDAREELARAQAQLRQAKQLAVALREVRLPALVASCGEIVQTATQLQSARERLAQLDLSDLNDLLEEKRVLEDERREIGASLEQKLQEKGGLEHRRQELALRIEQASSALARVELRAGSARRGIEQLAEVDSRRSLQELLAEVSQRAQAEGLKVADVERALAKARDELLHLHGEFREAVMKFNQASGRPEEQLSYAVGAPRPEDFALQACPQILALRQTALDRAKASREVGLAELQAEIERTQKGLNQAFVATLCNRTRNAVEKNISVLRQLNKVMEDRPFGGDRFQITWEWVREFKEYYDYFEYVNKRADQLDTLDLFEPAADDDRMERIGRKLVSLFLDNDTQKAYRELERICDYRNYRTYDVEVTRPDGFKMKLSTWGTGSGGQMETPAYVIRGIILANAFRLFTSKGPHFRVACSDESFAKMDEERRRQVIRFYNDQLGLQLIAAMPTINSGPLKDEFSQEWTFSRVGCSGFGELSVMSEAHGKRLKRDALQSLWEFRRARAREEAEAEFMRLEEQGALPLMKLAA